MLRIKLTAFLLLVATPALAAHPSIWINAAIKASLQQQVTDNTPEWQALRAWCDGQIGAENNPGYQGEEWYKMVTNFGMCYQASGDEKYATEGIIYLKALLRDNNAGPVGTLHDGNGGASSIQVDSGWMARTMGSGVAIARDWFDGSSALTSALVTESYDRTKDWIAWIDASGYSNNTPEDNYYAGYFAMRYLAGIAFDGDTADSATWRSDAETMWTSKVLPLINGGLSGGDWQEGWNYGEWASREYVQYPHAIYTYNGDATKWSATNWHHDLVRSRIHMLYPNRKYSSDDGSWSGSLKGNPNHATVDYLLAYAPLTAEEKGWAAWFKTSFTWDPAKPHKWEAFLWRSTDSPVTPTAATLGSSRLIAGTNRLLIRQNGWDNTNDTFVEFAVPPTGESSEGEANIGEFKISGYGESLVVDADTYQYTSDFSNVPNVTGNHTYAPKQEWWRPNVSIDRYVDAGTYVYARGHGLWNAYDGKLADNPSLSFYDRELMYVKPNYIVIADTIVPTDPATNRVKLQVHFMNNPTISGTTVVATNGAARIFEDIRGASLTLSKTDKSSTRPNVWMTEADLAQNTSYKVLSVFQTAPSSTATMDTITDISSASTVGVVIGNKAMLFNKSTTLVDSSSCVYTADATNTTLSGLKLNTVYTVKRAGTEIEPGINAGTGGVISFNSAAGSAEYIVAESGAGSNITCYPDVDNDLYPGAGSELVQTCSANHYIASHFTAMTIDCNDTDAAINPGATEICGDGIDQDCVGGDLACGGGGHASISTTGNMSFTAGGHLSIQ